MDIFKNPFFKINKFTALLCGVWPFESDVISYSTFIFFMLIECSFLFALIAGTLQKWNADFIIVLETLVIGLLVFGATLNCAMLFTSKNKTRVLYERIYQDWKAMDDKIELRILHKYTAQGQIHSVIFLIYISLVFIVSSTIAFIPRFRDTDKPIDYAHSFPYYYLRMSISDKYFHYQVLLHYSIAVLYSNIAYAAFTRTYLMAVRHTRGLYAITQHRLESTMSLTEGNMYNQMVNNKLIVFYLIKSIRQHNDALKCLQMTEDTFSRSIFTNEMVSLACITIFIFDIKYQESNNVLQLVRLLFLVMQSVIYALLFNIYGEYTLKSGDELFRTAYFIDWYKMPLDSRKLLLALMTHTTKRSHLTAGRVLMLSMKNYGQILKTAWQFATVLLTIVNKKQE